MSEKPREVPRRSVLETAALGGVGLTAGVVVTGAAPTVAAVEEVAAKETWLSERASCVSGNRLLVPGSDAPVPVRTQARTIYRPRSAEEIAAVIRSLPAATPVASVCGGHESSNAAAVASPEAVVFDMVRLESIEFHADGGKKLVTVGAGVVFRELVEAVKERRGALPVGTGPGVGVVGYVVNGGLSGYFSRRLGLLGQRVTKLTMVTAAGEIRVLEPGDELFTAMLGAGSALGVVVDLTIALEDEAVVRGAEQRVIGFRTRGQAVAFAREALRFQRDRVLPDESISMELVVAGAKVMVATCVFSDGFAGSMAGFVEPLETLAARHGLPIVEASHFDSWYRTAAALWPVIEGMKGTPLATLQHCVGTIEAPDDRVLDFLCDTVVAEAPLDEAPLSIVEIRTLGGAILSGAELPTGNRRHRFFCDLIAMYDAGRTSLEERRGIADRVGRILARAREVEGLAVDFSGTHSQPDDAGTLVSAPVIFGSAAAAEALAALKQRIDPRNRFRFHPFAKFL